MYSETLYALKSTDDFEIIDLSWERIFLHVTIRVKEESAGNLVLAKINTEKELANESTDRLINYVCDRRIVVEPRDKNGNVWHYILNMAAINENEFLENGRWAFVHVANNEEAVFCECSRELAYNLENLDKIYCYGKYKYSYNVFFTLHSISEQGLFFMINSRFMEQNENWKKNTTIKRKKTIKGKATYLYNRLKKIILKTIYFIFEKIFPKKGKNVLFMTETKPYLSGNLKYIDKRIRERKLDEKFKISYSYREAVASHNGIINWIKTIIKLANQDFIFVDDYAPLFNYITLGKRTKLIQVWHAGEGFKAIGYSRFGKTGSPYPSNNVHKTYDYVITGSERLVHVYSEAFGLSEEKLLPLGMARLDGFLDTKVVEEKQSEFFNRYPELEYKKIILFSPTFRGTGQKSARYDYGQLDLNQIYEFCGEEYVWAFKMHPFIKEKVNIPKKYQDRIIDLSNYENINDLYYVTEIMITDYSSAYYEFSLMKKPILFFTYDREIYELTRGVHKSVKETAPGKVCDSFEELINALKNKDYEMEKTLKFREENYGKYDGKASDRIIDTILLKQGIQE